MDYKIRIEGNELIARFMGWNIDAITGFWYQPNGTGFSCQPDFTYYHENWNALMPVIKKIRDWYNEDTKDVDAAFNVIKLGISQDIHTVYSAVVDFIKWWNNEQARTTNLSEHGHE